MNTIIRQLRSLVTRQALITFLRTSALPFFVYAALIAVVTPPVVAWYIRLSFLVNALIVFWVVWRYTVHAERHGDDSLSPGHDRWFIILLVFAGFFLLASRLLPFFRYGEAPLGYDTGFYLTSVDGSFAGILNGYGHRNFRALAWLALDWMGIPPIVYLHALYVATQFLVAGAIYFLARTLAPGRRIEYAAAAVFLFAVSIPQFFAYWWMFYQTELAIAFLFVTLALLHRRSWLALCTGVLGVAIHPATFLPFGLALVIYLIAQLLVSLFRLQRLDRDTLFLVFMSVIGLFAAKPLLPDIREFALVYLRGSTKTYGWLYTNYPLHLQSQFTGLYVDRIVAHLADIYLLPFAVLGFVLIAFRKLQMKNETLPSRLHFLAAWVAVLTVFVLVPVIYQHRWLIYLDLALILFAAYALVRFLRAMWRDRVSIFVAMLLLFGFTLHASLAVWGQKPQVYPDELAEIKAIASVAEVDAYAMTTESQYTPWLSAFSGRSVVDPGYLTLNQWPYDWWIEFWNGKSDARRHELLTMYDQPLYIFTGRAVANGAKYMQFIRNDPSFTRVSSYVWRYDPRAITPDDIDAMQLLEEAEAEASS